MVVYIEKMRFDIAETQRQAAERQTKAERDQKWEAQRFSISIVVALAAAAGAGATIATYFAYRGDPTGAVSNGTSAPAQSGTASNVILSFPPALLPAGSPSRRAR
jgi:hypothetical protein